MLVLQSDHISQLGSNATKYFCPCYPNSLNWQSNKGKNSVKKMHLPNIFGVTFGVTFTEYKDMIPFKSIS
nr:MAG TPA: hypothetical protein [Caudoviricetes sp.]